MLAKCSLGLMSVKTMNLKLSHLISAIRVDKRVESHLQAFSK